MESAEWQRRGRKSSSGDLHCRRAESQLKCRDGRDKGSTDLSPLFSFSFFPYLLSAFSRSEQVCRGLLPLSVSPLTHTHRTHTHNTLCVESPPSHRDVRWRAPVLVDVTVDGREGQQEVGSWWPTWKWLNADRALSSSWRLSQTHI